MLDLDTASRGNPLVDLGVFAAHLERDAVMGYIERERVAPALEALRAGYRQQSSTVLPPGLEVYSALSLIRLAAYPFRVRRPDWQEAIAGILGRAEALAAG